MIVACDARYTRHDFHVGSYDASEPPTHRNEIVASDELNRKLRFPYDVSEAPTHRNEIVASDLQIGSYDFVTMRRRLRRIVMKSYRL